MHQLLSVKTLSATLIVMYKLLSSLSLLRSSPSAGVVLFRPASQSRVPLGRSRRPFVGTSLVGNRCDSQSSFSTSALAFSSTDDFMVPDKIVLKLSIPTAEDLEEVGAVLAALSNPPDTIFLDGGTLAGIRIPQLLVDTKLTALCFTLNPFAYCHCRSWSRQDDFFKGFHYSQIGVG